jgi:transcription-repair coupling factor (superfamily II helicase)
MPLPSPLITSLKTGTPPALVEAPLAAHAYVLVEAVRTSGKPLVHVLPQDKDVATTASLCEFLAPDITVLQLPAWDTLPYDRVGPSHAITAARLNCLARLTQATRSADGPREPERSERGGAVAGANSPPAPKAQNYILLTTINAITQKLPPREVFTKARFAIRMGDVLRREAMFAFLEANGYTRVAKVMEAGEYAVRGSLIDIFPSGYEFAIRIDVFGDDVESLKRFDPLTQITDAPVESLELSAVHEILLQPETISRFRTRYLEMFGAVTKDDPLYASISEGRSYQGMEHWLPLFYERLDSLADYCDGAILSADHRLEALITERQEAIADYYNARKLHQGKDGGNYNPIPPEKLFLDYERLLNLWRTHARMTITPFAAEGTTSLNLRLSPQLFNKRHEEGQHVKDVILDYIRGAALPVILAANSAGSADRISKMLGLEGLPNVKLVTLPIEQGFITPEFILLTEQDMFGERIIRTTKKKRKAEAFLAEAASFIEGELIVHREHGIGRFEGLITVEVNNTRHDCLKLIYDGDDKLFLPVENIDLVSRYGATDGPVSLDKLGGVAWQKRKSALKKRLKMAAEALIKVAAERASIKAPELVADAGLYDEFVARFPYTETDDQLSAIEEVRADLLAGHAMDRLVCGDVGFGKTEVALRAAFIAASSGQQVAVIAPTTLLARQHFKTFTERFAGFSASLDSSSTSLRAERSNPAKENTSAEDSAHWIASALPRNDGVFTIRMLSRMTSAKDAAETKALLPEGKVDIVIGTHALLSSGIQFKNLGLLIVDEEQHFGVAQKEKLKQLKANIHVLTLSATPIPRTLQLSLSGVRELSLITTPPVDRLAVRTYVMPYDPIVLREAALREYHRGGKIFVVTPRVKYIAELQAKLHELVPEVKIAVAHGQMGATVLDKVMNEFYDGKYDMLLSTSIIESGIDIPTANTMIIDRADMFGLSQLYQLRGRVGRSKTRAYAYLTLPHGKKLTREAERRLEVMQQLDTLGAGFQLASHDMDIRGFGNLLGEEQSGHVKEVGIELYQSMLEEAITDMKSRRNVRSDSEEAPESWSPQINLGMSVLIPETYIEDLSLRLSLYRRAAGLANDAELDGFAAELVDRFGQLPTEVEHLLSTLRIKLLCKSAGVVRLDVGPKGVVLAFRNNKFANPPALIDHIAKHAGRIKLRADQTLFIAAESHDDLSRLKIADAVAREVAVLLPAPKEIAV